MHFSHLYREEIEAMGAIDMSLAGKQVSVTFYMNGKIGKIGKIELI
jgi:hypothetical protein